MYIVHTHGYDFLGLVVYIKSNTDKSFTYYMAKF